jgi:hypothetical protein
MKIAAAMTLIVMICFANNENLMRVAAVHFIGLRLRTVETISGRRHL